MTFADSFAALTQQIASLDPVHHVGRVAKVKAGVVHVSGLSNVARIGQTTRIDRKGQSPLVGEIVQLDGDITVVLPETSPDGVGMDDRVILGKTPQAAPCDSWMGRVIDPMCQPLDGRSLMKGAVARDMRSAPPPATQRRGFGDRLNTGLALTNTLLPIVQGQRVGLFAGSGVGKSSLLGHLAQNMQSDVVIIAMIGERGRELRHFLDVVLGPEALKRCVIVAATSDQSALQRRRCIWTAMSVAEHFRDQGKQVLLLADSITRFAEAHREVAVAAKEAPVLRGYPPSTSHMIMSLCERAGPGAQSQGDITAIFSVLVAGSDMEEPVADIMRGVLDGHIVLDREIAERGRYPAIDVLRSVSRSLPAAATEDENALIARARKLLGVYDSNAVMIRAGLYAQGSDEEVDQAIAAQKELEEFMERIEHRDCKNSFRQLELAFRRAGATDPRRNGTAKPSSIA